MAHILTEQPREGEELSELSGALHVCSSCLGLLCFYKSSLVLLLLQLCLQSDRSDRSDTS